MTTSAKVLQVLQLFRDGRTRMRASDVMASLAVSSATAYRYLADLEQAGLVERASSSEYVLGPTVVELDRVIRENDPLIAAASDIMKTLAERTGGTALLCRLHGRKVMCVHQVRGRAAPHTVSYERGRAMPLFRGATSKVILAHLSASELDAIAATQGRELREAGWPAAPQSLAQELQRVRAAHVYATRAEVDAEAMGWAVALHHGKHLLGSLSLVLSRKTPPAEPGRLADQLRRAALRIEGRLQA
jgi:DNA-binding IclR family transcriptional regulator